MGVFRTCVKPVSRSATSFSFFLSFDFPPITFRITAFEAMTVKVVANLPKALFLAFSDLSLRLQQPHHGKMSDVVSFPLVPYSRSGPLRNLPVVFGDITTNTCFSFSRMWQLRFNPCTATVEDRYLTTTCVFVKGNFAFISSPGLSLFSNHASRQFVNAQPLFIPGPLRPENAFKPIQSRLFLFQTTRGFRSLFLGSFLRVPTPKSKDVQKPTKKTKALLEVESFKHPMPTPNPNKKPTLEPAPQPVKFKEMAWPTKLTDVLTDGLTDQTYLFYTWLEDVLRATAACNFSFLCWTATSAPAALASLLFEHPEPRIIEKTQRFATFPTFGACVSSF